MSSTRRDFLRQTGCAMLGMGAFAAGIQDFGLVNALAQSAATDYKALVCVFLNGGNDGTNTVIPLDGEYTNYFNVRNPAGLALPNQGAGSLLTINAPSHGRQFGFHPSMTDMQTLFNDGKLAVLCNAGPLIEPLTRATYRDNTGRRPLQLFSHFDQVNQWLTSISNDNSKTGWGGRMADRTTTLNGPATFPQMVSIAGVNLFITGAATRPFAIADARTSLATVLPLTMTGSSAEISSRRAAFDLIRAQSDGARLVKAAADTTTSALQTSAALANTSGQPPLRDFPNTTLGYQLEQVARLIQLRDALGMKRQVFFCSLGGFDTHNNQMAANSHASLWTQVSQALKTFYDTTVDLGIADKVTTFTHSDFGRTFQPAGTGAGVGSDHGWGGHHLIIGGAVRGGDFYGRYPTLALGGPDDTDTRGRFIPTTSVEQYAATLATWYGLSSNDLSLVFPLIGRFATPNLGFML
ncbi:MAG: DUF1501 domain-containing protein [Pyrinomonadaceae bacterium]